MSCDVLECPLQTCYTATIDLCGDARVCSFYRKELKKTAARKKKTADRDEILAFLTDMMRNEEMPGKDRMSAAIKLGSYLGLDGGDTVQDSFPQVVIYDGDTTDKLP